MRTNMKKWELKRKVKRTGDRYLGDKGYLSEKFKNIYGGGDYSEEIEKIRNSNRNRGVHSPDALFCCTNPAEWQS